MTHMPQSTPRRRPRPSRSWYLITNHLNLLYMLAAGLVTDPAGFRGKHYVDSLSAFPGWIPLFRSFPARALAEAVSERKHLRPCVVALDFNGLSGPVRVLSAAGKLRQTRLPRPRFGNDDVCLLVPAPLPLKLFTRASFRSDDDLQAFRTAAGDVSNVLLDALPLEKDAALFDSASDAAWPVLQSDLFPGGRAASSTAPSETLPGAQALGGLLAMLYHGGNRSDLASQLFRSLAGQSASPDGLLIEDPVLAQLPHWLRQGRVSDAATMPARLYWGVVSALAAGHEAADGGSAADRVLHYLDAELEQLADEKYQARLQRLLHDMRSCMGLGAGTLSELLERNKGSFSRPLLLSCLRESSPELLEFSHPELTEAEYVLACILFGVRDGWLRLPAAMRSPALSDVVSTQMACQAQTRQDSVLLLPDSDPLLPLRALLLAPAGQLTALQEKAALHIAQESGWQDCIETVIRAPDGRPFPAMVAENGKLVLPFDAQIEKRLCYAAFLRQLGQWPPVAQTVEARARALLNTAVGD